MKRNLIIKFDDSNENMLESLTDMSAICQENGCVIHVGTRPYFYDIDRIACSVNQFVSRLAKVYEFAKVSSIFDVEWGECNTTIAIKYIVEYLN